MNTSSEVRRLAKSRSDRMIDGVCGGVAAYFGLDATLVRIAWVLLTLLGGSGLLLYIAAMILMPKDPSTPPPEPSGTTAKSTKSNTTFWGVLLVVVGLFWLAGNLGVHLWHPWWGLSLGIVIPVLLILAGVAFLFGGRNSMTNAATRQADQPVTDTAGATEPQRTTSLRLRRSRSDKKLAGVCAGIGDYVQIDPVIIRLGFVMAGLASFGIALILYVILAVVVPLEPDATPAAAPVPL
jgi:phage shock protein PspC (stress-responsive transcriptional regulator)